MTRTAAALLATLTLVLGAVGGAATATYVGRDDAKAEVAPPECVKALRRQLIEAQATGAQGTRPKACDGVSDAALQVAAGQALAEVFTR